MAKVSNRSIFPFDDTPSAEDLLLTVHDPSGTPESRVTDPQHLIKALPNMVGDSGSGGSKGLVPAPSSGDSTKFLRGDGTWANTSGTITVGGSDTQLQFNDDGTLAGASRLTYNDDIGIFSVDGMFNVVNSGEATKYAGVFSGPIDGTGSGKIRITSSIDFKPVLTSFNIFTYGYQFSGSDTLSLPSYLNNSSDTGKVALFSYGDQVTELVLGSFENVPVSLFNNKVIRLTLDSNGNVIINESGFPVDFRVEGDTLSNLFFVDGSADKIGINNAFPSGQFHQVVSSGVVGHRIDITASHGTNAFEINGSGSNGEKFIVTDRGFVGINTGSAVDVPFRVNGGEFGSLRYDARSSTINCNKLSFNNIGGNEQFWIIGNTANNISQIGTFTSRLDLFGNLITVSAPLTINEDKGDNDFRVESNYNTHALFIDAGLDVVGIGTSSPTNKVDIVGDIGLKNSGVASVLKLYEPSGLGNSYTGFKARSQSSDIIYTLPDTLSNSGYVLSHDGTGLLNWIPNGSGSITATPGGTNTQIQFNDSGSLAGASGFIYNDSNGRVGIGDPSFLNGALHVVNKVEDGSAGYFQSSTNNNSPTYIVVNAGGIPYLASANLYLYSYHSSYTESDGLIPSYLNSSNDAGKVALISIGSKVKELLLGSWEAKPVSLFNNNLTRLTLDTNGNVIINESGLAVDFRVESDNQTNCLFIDGSLDLAQVGVGKSTELANLGGRIYTDTTETGNIAASPETDLMTYDLPPNAYSSNNATLKIKYWGRSANNANSKIVYLYVDANLIGTLDLQSNTIGKWIITADVIRTGSSAQVYCVECREAGMPSEIYTGTLTMSESDTLQHGLKIDADSDDDVIIEGHYVDFIN